LLFSGRPVLANLTGSKNPGGLPCSHVHLENPSNKFYIARIEIQQ